MESSVKRNIILERTIGGDGMGAWGPELYQDDLAADIRDAFKEQLKRGKTGEQITKEMLEEYETELLDPDDAPIFWFALADTQWELGRLEDGVKKNALYYIQDGGDLKRWELENPREAKKRTKALEELKKKLLTPQPPKKKVSLHKLYQCEWKVGDIYAYPLESEYAQEKGISGRYFLFHKVGETIYYPGHIIPVVRVKITKSDKLPQNVNEFNDLEYVQTSVTKCDENISQIRGKSFVNGIVVDKYVTDEFGFLPTYRLELINTSKRVIPKKLVYVGNYKDIRPPHLEFVPEDISIPGFMWKFFDNIMIERYCGYNLGQYEIYSKRN